MISSTVTIMPISKIADRIGKRHIFLFGVSLFCVSSLAVYFVNSLYGLFLLRILQGLVLLIQPVLMALLSPVTGVLSDRINPAVLASSGMILITFGLCLLAVDVSYPFFWLIALALVIIGIGFALFTAPNNNAIMGSVTPKYYGAASSVVSTVRLIGQVLSVAIITLILSQSGASAASDWLAQHIQQAFIVFTILCAIGIVPSAARSK
ncbi:MFS transporter [Megasphaera sp.]|uniref:MFS transporter n=1 Tax=Megasphaera sp. TaxID=2023260 RepID=UPI00307ADFCB